MQWLSQGQDSFVLTKNSASPIRVSALSWQFESPVGILGSSDRTVEGDVALAADTEDAIEDEIDDEEAVES